MFRSYVTIISLLGLALAVGVGCGDDAKDGGDAGTGGSGGSGGTTGSGGSGTPGFDPAFTNEGICCDGTAEGDPTCIDEDNLVNCDYGCSALGNLFGFLVHLGRRSRCRRWRQL